jgi:hypothetical protein
MKNNILLLSLILLLSCEKDPIFGLERGWLRSDDSNNNSGDNEDTGGNGDGGDNDTSNVDYTITVNSPNGGESWETSDSENIQWETDAPQSYSVGIQLYRSSNYSSSISTQTSNTGEFTWLIPSDLTNADNYKIRVYLIDYPEIEDFSDNYFSVNTNANYLYEDFEDLSDWTEEAEGWYNSGDIYSIPTECQEGDCARYYLNAYNPGPAIINRIVNVEVGQVLTMYTFGGYGADVEVYLGDILIGTISSWDGAGQINYTIANTGSYYLRIVGGGPLQAIGYIDELYIQ